MDINIVFVIIALVAVSAVVVVIVMMRNNRTVNQLRAEITGLKNSLVMKDEMLEMQKKQHEEMNKANEDALQKTIELAAQRVADKQTESLNRRNDEMKTANGEMIEDAMKKFTDSIDKSRRERIEQSARFSEQMEHMKEQTLGMQSSADRITNALTGSTKVQGDFGESLCEQVLVNSGMEKGKHYDTQVPIKDVQNKDYRLDFVLHCPNQGDIIIDSKMTLTSLMKYKEAVSEKDRTQAIKEIHDSVLKHINELAIKAYHKTDEKYYENVIMYVPVREALYLATLHNPQLLNEACKKGVWVVDSSSLLPLIAIVKTVWVVEDKDKNVEAVLDAAGKLYEKFSTFSQTYAKVGNALKSGLESFDKSMGQLCEGDGNVIRRITAMQNMGMKLNKSKVIHKDLLEASGEALQDLEDNPEIKSVV